MAMRSKHGYYYGRSPDFRHAPAEQRVLVALVPTLRDWHILHEQGWYRIPVRSAPQPMQYGYIAFDQTRGWGQPDWAVNWWAHIAQIKEATRLGLLPREERQPWALERCYQLDLIELRPLPAPIPSRRRRFIVFISTTLGNIKRNVRKMLYALFWAIALLSLLAAVQSRLQAKGDCTSPSACKSSFYWESPLLK